MRTSLPVGKPVEVISSSSKYQGILQSMSDTDIFLLTPTKKLSLPFELVKNIRELDAEESDRLLKLLGRKR